MAALSIWYVIQHSKTVENVVSEQYEKVLDLLAPHRKATHTLEQTLNRLFRKYLKRRKPDFADNPLELSARNISVIEETRPKKEFGTLAEQDFSKGAYDYGNPIVIVRFRGHDCLIDGNHRGRFWLQNGDASPHTAFVLVVNE
jgi:hypothetical protein